MRADAGIVISASHNPYRDNGIKIFGGDGFKLPDDSEAEIEQLMEDPALLSLRKGGMGIGRAVKLEDAHGRYVVFAKTTFPRDLSLEGLHVVVDAAHGAAYRAAPLVFQELGASVTAIGVRPNGTNINRNCGALHPAKARAEVVRRRAQIGIALDGDADRVIVIDELGEVVDGDAGDGDVRRPHDTGPRAEERSGGRDRDEQPGPGARARATRRPTAADAGGGSLRRRGDAPGRLQPGRRAVGPPDLPGPRLDGRRHHRRAAGAGVDAAAPASRCPSWPRPRWSACPRCSRTSRCPARRPLEQMLELQKGSEAGARGAGRRGQAAGALERHGAEAAHHARGPDEATLRARAQELAAAARRDLGA
jgi:phosphoglucosamine mutase